MARQHNLDYLRGLAAFLIMIYHYFNPIVIIDSSHFLGRAGYYGVSIFYILSGLTLYHVYESRLDLNFKSVFDFAKNRAFRIYPLYCIAVGLTLFYLPFSLKSIVENLSGLFGFIHWDGAMVPGGWSIGNELVFSAFFPIFLFLAKKTKIGFLITHIMVLGVYLFFGFYILQEYTSVSAWDDYVNPGNQLYLFLLGITISKFFKEGQFSNALAAALLITGLMILFFLPTHGDQDVLVKGWYKIIFTGACTMITLGFYKIRVSLPKFIDKPLAFIGEASFSIYLLHQLIMRFVKYTNGRHFHLEYSSLIFPSIALTMIISYFVFNYYEKPFIKLGKKVMI